MNFRRLDNTSAPVVLLLVLILLLPPHLLGAVVPGNWSKVENLEPNTEILVQLKMGEQLLGSFVGLDPTSIQLQEGEVSKSYRREDIKRIETFEWKRNSGKDGLLIGMLMGGVAGGVLGGLFGKDNSFYLHPPRTKGLKGLQSLEGLEPVLEERSDSERENYLLSRH